MSKSELINSASEDDNYGTEESKTSDDKYLPDFTKLQQYMQEPCVSKESVKENCPGKELSHSEEVTGRIEIFSGVLLVNTNQWLLMQKEFDPWINI